MADNILSNQQALAPPSQQSSLFGWARKNLFGSWYDAILTFLALGLLLALARFAFTWFLQAEWEVIQANIRLLMVGRYPVGQLWRAWLVLHLLAVIIGLSWGIWVRGRRFLVLGGLLVLIPVGLAVLFANSPEPRLHLAAMAAAALVFFGLGRLGGLPLARLAVGAWVAYFPLVLLIIYGLNPGDGVFQVVPTNFWGGLLLTFLLTVVGILFSFPLGILLALGRRSSLPVIRWSSIVYIELIRGVPLITILFMASVMVPLFLPGGVTVDRVLRAMIGLTLFSAAYLAENVRGGLQAIPRGQFEAAHALGLNGFLTMALIVLPQALRLVIPVLVGQFISLFKDTSLVATIGLLDLLGIARSVLAQPQFIRYQHEVLVFIAVIYWVISYLMSFVSQRLEIALGVGER